jgi:DNA topoisomerase-1
MPAKAAAESAKKTKTVKKAPKLVIVESPAKAKTIAKYLGKGYKVEASNGHVRDLPKSQIGVDVEHGFEPKYITIRDRGEIIDRLKREAKSASAVYLATDPDREGEAISWHLAHLLKIDEKSLCRIEFNEITKDAIKKAIKSPRAIDLDLVDAQQARRLLDRLVGYQISPILWRKVHKGLSAGRVQSVATRIVCDREEEIQAFVPEEYWTLAATIESEDPKVTLQVQYVGAKDEKNARLPNREAVDRVIRVVSDAPFVVDKIETSEKRVRPSAPFTTSSLQQEASRRFGFSTKRTMVLAQQLYEGVEVKGIGPVGLITYIRTDSVRIADEAREAAKALILSEYGPEYYPQQPNVYKGKNGAQDAHEAIRPTTLDLNPRVVKASLSRDQYRLYTLVYNRFVASQMTPAVFETCAAKIHADEYRFRASASHVIFQGYRKVYMENDETQSQEPAKLDEHLREGLCLRAAACTPTQHFTEPPARYTEAMLVRALEEQGIGRPSTYAPIISTILDKGYVRREGRLLVPTELGGIVTGLMKEYFTDIVDIAFTADMEKKLDSVESGNSDWRQILTDFYGPFHETLEEADAKIEKIVIEDEVTDIICEKCGANMVIKNGRNGRFYACPNFPACRNTKSILQKVDAICPKCGGQVIVRRSRRGRVFYGCENYPQCDFNSWDMPVNEKCPVCGGYMVKKRNRAGQQVYRCANAECSGEMILNQQEEKGEQ